MSISAQSKPQGLIDLCASIPDATPEAITAADRLWVTLSIEYGERLGFPPMNTGALTLQELLGCGINPHLIDRSLIQATLLSPAMHCSTPEPKLCREIEDRIEKEVGRPVMSLLRKLKRMERLRELIALEIDEKAELSTHVEDINVVRNRRILFALNRDLRAIFLRLAIVGNHLRNERLAADPLDRRIELVEMTQYLIPTASILMPSHYHMRLEDLVFSRFLPEQYRKASEVLNEGRPHREEATRRLIKEIRGILRDEEIEADVTGRAKSLSSFFRKHWGRDLPIEEIFDLMAIRIVVRECGANFGGTEPPSDPKTREKILIDICYRLCHVLNKRYKLYQYEDEYKFSDYILSPLGDLNYQSLHMIMEDALGDIFEVQIRTEKMDREAEFGHFAHHLYKEKRKPDFTDVDLLAIRKEVVSRHPVDGGIEGLNRTIEDNSKLNSVCVFSADNEVFLLPTGATVLDFAYSLHSQIGHRTRLAKVNGQPVPLDKKLNNFDRVVIVTGKKPNPSEDWLKILVSSKAKRHVKKLLDLKDSPHQAETGYQEFHDAVARRRTGSVDLTDKKEMQALLKSAGVERENDFFHKIGSGELDVGKLIDSHLAQHGERELRHRLRSSGLNLGELLRSPEMEKVLLKRYGYRDLQKFFIDINSGELKAGPVSEFLKGYLIDSLKKKRRKPEFQLTNSSYGVMVGDLETNTHIKMAGCCMPVLGDDITGYVSKGGVITIHRIDCRYLSSDTFDPNRFVAAQWLPDPPRKDDTQDRRRFPVKMRVEALDRQGLLADLTQAISREDVNIEDLRMEKPQGLSTMIHLSIMVQDKVNLDRVAKKISSIDGVLRLNLAGR
jgi:GTP pyrophosphokinase